MSEQTKGAFFRLPADTKDYLSVDDDNKDKNDSKIYKFSGFFPARSSDTGSAGTGIEILDSFSAHPLLQITSKYPPEVQVQHETCNTICGTPVQAILDQKKLTGLAGGVKEQQNMVQNGPRFYISLASAPSRGP